MCKLYAFQGEITRDEAEKKIKEKVKIIRRSESHGLGIALQVDGKLGYWKCGESVFDYEGENVLLLLDDRPRMATITIHGRTSTSSNTGVVHAHPRKSEAGFLMHNGVVRPKKFSSATFGEGGEWTEEYALDTDYLTELATRGLLDRADEYLDGYAGVLLLDQKGELTVQNQGASLFMNVKSGEVEFGTTLELCSMGTRFENMRAEALEGSVYVRPIGSMSRSSYYHGKYSHLTGKDEEKKQESSLTSTSTCSTRTSGGDGKSTQSQGAGTSTRTPEQQRLRNKKGKSRFLHSSLKFKQNFVAPFDGDKNAVITIGKRVVSIEEWLEEMSKKRGQMTELEERKLLTALRAATI